MRVAWRYSRLGVPRFDPSELAIHHAKTPDQCGLLPRGVQERRMNFCPVCGYALPYSAADFHICPSCGTEFGYDDSGTSYQELRNRWIRTGPSWWSPVQPQPRDWDPVEQMRKGLILNPAGMFTGSQGFASLGRHF